MSSLLSIIIIILAARLNFELYRLRDKPPPTYKEEEEDELVEEEDELVELDEPIDTFGSDSLDGITMLNEQIDIFGSDNSVDFNDSGDFDFDFDSIGSLESSPLVVRGTQSALTACTGAVTSQIALTL